MLLTDKTRRTLWICGLLVAVTLAAFLPAVNHGFTNLDDSQYVWLNQHVRNGLHWEGVTWAFRTGYMGNWHPLTWVSHMLDAQLFGLRPGWHHLTNVLFHSASSVLLFLVLQRLTGAAWRSAYVAALFALHPLHVESVAWISERKDVLSAFFFMLTLWAYVRYAQVESLKSKVPSPEPVSSQESAVSRGEAPGLSVTDNQLPTTDDGLRTPQHAAIFYLLTLCFFGLGLMSKGMVVTVPFVLLLLDYWPLRRLQLSSLKSLPSTVWPLLKEKLPLFVLTVAGSLATFVAQQHYGAVRSLEVLSVSQRVGNALVACAMYLRQTFWPTGLAVFYPLHTGLSAAGTILAGVVLLGITAWVVGSARRRPHLFVGWFWFLGMLVPVIGLVQIGQQQRADRYSYLPLIGIFVMVVWEVSERWSAWRRRPSTLTAVAVGVLLACLALTCLQLSYWRDDGRLFRHAVEVTRDNWLAHQGLGHALLFQGKPDEAIIHYQAAAAIRPSPELRQVLGETLSQRGRFAEAAEQFSELIKFKPKDVPALVQFGIAQARQGRTDEAQRAFAEALRLDPADAGAHNGFGNLLAQLGEHGNAVRHFEEAVRLNPHHAGAHNNLAISCRKLGRIDEAVTHYREAMRLDPSSLQALNNLAWVLAADPDARFRNGTEAVELATRACELTRYQNPIPLGTLAAAYGEAGKFHEAVSFAEQAQALIAGDNNALGPRLRAMLEAFRAGQPYHGD